MRSGAIRARLGPVRSLPLNLPLVASFVAAAVVDFLAVVCLHSLWLGLRPERSLLGSSLISSLAVVFGTTALAAAGRWPWAVEPTLFGGATAFFAYQLFFFLGPATADRSLTAHLLLYLRESGDAGLDAERVNEDHLPEAFIAKRLDECREAALIDPEARKLRLTRKGRGMAAIYAGLVALYRLRQRSRWRDSFTRPSTDGG